MGAAPLSIQGIFRCVDGHSDENVRVGINHIFLKTIQKITDIEFPEENDIRYQGEACLRITESDNMVHRLWTPVSGKIIAINPEVKKDFSILKKDPYNTGWILVMSPVHLKEDLRNLLFINPGR